MEGKDVLKQNQQPITQERPQRSRPPVDYDEDKQSSIERDEKSVERNKEDPTPVIGSPADGSKTKIRHKKLQFTREERREWLRVVNDCILIVPTK